MDWEFQLMENKSKPKLSINTRNVSMYTDSMKLSRWILPHPDTHEKAHLLSVKAFLVYFLLFFLIEFVVRGFSPIGANGVLGISSLGIKDLIAQTNQERVKNGLAPLEEDTRLNAAAAAKAQNMFEENYWAHYSPSGKDPWGFIQGEGYQFSYAGENLARNFETSPEVVAAWMASPTHRENIINTHYTNVGMAVAEGTINGQKTILVVQEFGKPSQNMLAAISGKNTQLASSPAPATPVVTLESSKPNSSPDLSVKSNTLNQTQTTQVLVAGSESSPAVFSVGSVTISRTFGLTIIGLLSILIVLDLYILRRRMVHRLSARHLPHLALLSVAGSILWNSGGGQITQQAVTMIIGN